MKTSNVIILEVEFNKEGFNDKVNKLITILHQEAKNENFGVALPEYNKEDVTTGNKIQVYLINDSKLVLNNRLNRFLIRSAKQTEIKHIDLSKYKGKEGYVYYKANFLKKLTVGYVKRIIYHSEKYTPYQPKSFINKFIYEEYKKNKSKDFNINIFVKKLKEKANAEKVIFPFFKVESKSLAKNNVDIAIAVVEIGEKETVFDGYVDFNTFNSYGLSKTQALPNL